MNRRPRSEGVAPDRIITCDAFAASERAHIREVIRAVPDGVVAAERAAAMRALSSLPTVPIAVAPNSLLLHQDRPTHPPPYRMVSPALTG